MAGTEIEHGAVDRALAEELPGLGIAWVGVDARTGRSPAPVRRRLRELASRIAGAKVVESRQDSVPWAYRVLWRRLGVDPDVDPTPIEGLMLQRLRHGGLRSHGLAADAAVLATLETGVPVIVLDAAAVEGGLRLRPAGRGESLGGDAEAPLRVGEIVYADARRPLARITGQVADDCLPGRGTTAMLACALAAGGVAAIAVEEALWTAADVLGCGGTLESSTKGGHR